MAACTRPPVEGGCPDVAAGELVFSELQRGAGDAPDQLELYNASGAAIPLSGLRFGTIQLDGSDETSVLVRDQGLTAAAGGFTLVPLDLPTGGAVELWACDTLVDRMIVRALPASGSWSLDGTALPDADDNDDEASWCASTASPAERNPPCP